MRHKLQTFLLGISGGFLISILIRGFIIVFLINWTHNDRTSLNEDDIIIADGNNQIYKNVKLVLVRVQTARKYMSNRMKAAHGTWAQTIPGDVIFFAGEESKGFVDYPKIPLIILKGIQDSMYPPQKKSFMMLKYMHDYFLNQYEWFIRADDDVFIIGEMLEKFLSSLNSSKLYSIGQGGEGREHERDKLGLPKNVAYCMGGPGIILSRAMLAKLAPNIEHCLGNTYTLHEDTELGRCIYQFTGISCTIAAEVKIFSYQLY